MTALPQLPVDEVLPSLVDAVARGRNVVLHAPTGAGKTTRVPPALATALPDGAIWLVEPRRIAARAAALRIADELGSPLGDYVGVHVRFERRVSSRTKIVAMTDGIALRLLQADPFLEGVAAIVLDEFHERRIATDLVAALARDVQREARPDLRLVVMSATLHPEPIADWLGSTEIVRSAGRTYPVAIDHLDRVDDRPLEVQAAAGARAMFAQSSGDVLVFLPGVREIEAVRGLLARDGDAFDVVPLYGALPPEAQDRALRASDVRRIVLATNVAESSVTLPSVDAVVDSGLAKVLRFDAGAGLDRLETERISRASADQRAGRAGRTQAGRCLRLWTPSVAQRMPEFEVAELHRVDAVGPLLELLSWGVTDPELFGWFEAPDPARWSSARATLEAFGALENGRLTERGRLLATLPVSPRLGTLVLEGAARGVLEDAALAAAIVSERDVVLRNSGDDGQRDTRSDLVDRVHAVRAYDRGGTPRFPPHRLHRGAVHGVRRIAEQLRKAVPRDAVAAIAGGTEALERAIAVAWSDRIAQRRAPEEDRGRLWSGRGVRFGRDCAVRSAAYVACVDLDAGARGAHSEAWVRMGSAVEASWIPWREVVTRRFDAERERVVALEERVCGALVARSTPTTCPTDEETAALLAEAASSQLARALTLDAKPVVLLRDRLAFLSRHAPELGLPLADDAQLVAWLPMWCLGLRSFGETRKLDVASAIRAALPWASQQALDREAPLRLTLENGREFAVRYDGVSDSGEPRPVIAARIQHLFGVRTTPRVAHGHVAVQMHLLAPNMRPQQVTTDLESFWRETYPEVRKTLRGRYPKHAWPEDPLAGS